jgi:hypothetical protein
VQAQSSSRAPTSAISHAISAERLTWRYNHAVISVKILALITSWQTVTAHSLEWYENAGRLSKMRVDESKIAEENRIPRVTSATWKYDSGAVGSFTHVVGLQGTNYSCELEVFADGYSLKYVLFLCFFIPFLSDLSGL